MPGKALKSDQRELTTTEGQKALAAGRSAESGLVKGPSGWGLSEIVSLLEGTWTRSADLPLLRYMYAVGVLALVAAFVVAVARHDILKLGGTVLAGVGLLTILPLIAINARPEHSRATRTQRRLLAIILWAMTLAFVVVAALTVYWVYLQIIRG